MKKITLSLVMIAIALIVIAQAPQAFKYQTVVRDNAGEILANQDVSFQISILEGSTMGTAVYVETHDKLTNEQGLVSLEIGDGEVESGVFADIYWGEDSCFLQVERDENGGDAYQLMGTSQLLAVPYSLYSEFTGDTTRWRKNNNKLFYNEGNVGIGITNPLAKLSVDGSGYFKGNAYFIDHDTNEVFIDLYNVTSDWMIVAAADTNRLDIRVWDGDTVLSTMANGNVGIGTINPLAKLEVNSILRVTPSAVQNNCNQDTPGSIYFDELLNEFCFCDGISWKQFDGGGDCGCCDNDNDNYDICNPEHPNDTDGLPADCDDNDPTIYPSAVEMCDGKDNDCNSEIDEAFPELGDICDEGLGECQAYGNIVCTGDGTGVECNAVPGIPEEEICNGIDDDCDGFIDANPDPFSMLLFYHDDDGDGWGDWSNFELLCPLPEGNVYENLVENYGDCDDQNCNVYPGATEIPGNGIDEDCDGLEICYVDADDDGYRPDGISTITSTDMDCFDTGEATWTDPIGDCNDDDSSINLGAQELCDGLDNDCDSEIDEDLVAPLNVSQEGVCFGSTQICDGEGGWIPGDYGPNWEPLETTCDGLDNDCDGLIDEDILSIYYFDADADDFGNDTITIMSCDQPFGYAEFPGDCNDLNPLVNPAAQEICDDGIDNDCDGLTDGEDPDCQ